MAEREQENDPAARASRLVAQRAESKRTSIKSPTELTDATAPVSSDASVRFSKLEALRATDRRDDAGEPKALQDVPPNSLRAFVGRNKGYILSTVGVIIAVAVLVVVMGAFMTGCSAERPAEEVVPTYVSPYDWTALERNGDRLSYVVDGEVKSRIGVDVSENQQEVDWNAVAGDGIDFAMVRVGYRGATVGDLYLDDRYWDNIDGARAAGLDCGVYFFSQAQTVDEAIEEADFVLDHLNGLSLEYPVAFDSEEVALGHEKSRTTGLSNDQMTAIARAFCERIETAGYRSMIYGNHIDMARYNYAEIADYPVWWAEYGVSSPAHNLDIVMWQYTNGGVVSGIPTSVDLNLDLLNVL